MIKFYNKLWFCRKVRGIHELPTVFEIKELKCYLLSRINIICNRQCNNKWPTIVILDWDYELKRCPL